MTCTEQDTVTSWLVESESRPEEHHLVELLDYNGFGQCACEHFQMVLGPTLREGFQAKPCKHITAAKLAFADKVIDQMLQNILDQSTVPADLPPPQNQHQHRP
jgi:hypothetical protein